MTTEEQLLQKSFQHYDPPMMPSKNKWKFFIDGLITKAKQHLTTIYQKLQAFDQAPKVVKIASMEINLTALWRGLTAPVRWFANLFKPKRGRSRRKRLSDAEKQLRLVKTARMVTILGFMGVIASIIVFFGLFAWYSRDLPEPGKVVRRSGYSTKIVDRNGKLLYDLFQSENRVPITVDQIPEYLKQATIAVEDKDFYKHKGFDFLTVLRIPYNLLVRKRVVGGSTLTQQLVKNVLLTSERTISRKFKEFVLALQIERKFSKDEILGMYLNEAPYGGTAWGVGAAAETYFNKQVSELSLVESAILAGLPQRPTAYSPFLGKTDENGELLWKVRTKGVLRRMSEDGYISNLEYDQALNDLENMEFQQQAFEIRAPHFVFYVQDLLEQMYGSETVEGGGLTITTTLDLDLQDKAQQIVQEEIDKIKDLNITNGAVVAMDPQTGEILAMVGSVDYFSEEIDGQFNVAVDGLRQPGSSIKPVTYLTMFKQGYTPATMLMDVETTFATNDQMEDPYQPKNYDGKFRGPVSVRNSLGSSLNVPAVKSVAMVGVDNFLQTAYDMGFDTLEPSEENFKRFGLAVTLGGAEVHLLDTASAYSSFANGGYKVEPVSILKVEDKDGHTLFEHRHVQGAEVMTPEEAFLIDNILSDNNARLMAFGANSLLNTGKPIAVKTGTTNDQRDNWTIGWSQEIMVGVWVGNNDNSAMKRVASGITGASPIWRNVIMTALEQGYQTPEWEVPPGIEQVDVDKISGYPAHDDFESKKEYVIKGTLPTTPDPIHTFVNVCKGENKLATEARVASGDYEKKEFFVFQENDPVSQDGKNRWQEAINAWVTGQDNELYKPPTEYCGDSKDVSARLLEPGNEKTFDNEDIKIKVEAGSGDGIDKIEIIVNGEIKETVNDWRYEGTMHLSKGRYEIYAKAYSRGGKDATSNKSKIGTGGENWKEPEPSPTPSPSPSPTPSPSPSPVACGQPCSGSILCESGYVCDADVCKLQACVDDPSSCDATLCNEL